MWKWQLDVHFRGSGELLPTAAYLLVGPDQLLLLLPGKLEGKAPLHSHPSSEGPGTEGPEVWRGQALTMALFHLWHPTWPLEKPLSSDSLGEGVSPAGIPSDHRVPLADFSLPGLWALTPLLQRTAVAQEGGDRVQLGGLGPSHTFPPQYPCPLGSLSVAWSPARGG